MTDNIRTPESASEPTVECFLEALARRDFDRLAATLAPDLWLRALLPRSLHETHTAREAVDAYRSWYGSAGRAELLEARQYRMAGRHFLSYRLRVRPAWAPDRWHLIEQAGFCRVQEGRISRLDVVCTGFHPAAEEASAPARVPGPVLRAGTMPPVRRPREAR